MNKIVSMACATTIAVGAFASSAVPVFAMPLAPVAPKVDVGSDVQLVQERWRRDGKRNWDGRRDGPRGFYRRGGVGYYNGYRGHRDYRPGYRRHGDLWFPAAAFLAGALIGGALSEPAPRYYEPRRIYREPVRRVGSAHVEWCFGKYRSYRASDNTYQPYNGPRTQCYSPYN